MTGGGFPVQPPPGPLPELGGYPPDACKEQTGVPCYPEAFLW